MHPYHQSLGSTAGVARREQVLNIIRDHRYLAGQKLALDEAHEQAVAEVARARLLADAGFAPGWRLLTAGLRQRVGAALVRVGTRLQGAGSTGRATAAPAGSGAAS